MKQLTNLLRSGKTRLLILAGLLVVTTILSGSVTGGSTAEAKGLMGNLFGRFFGEKAETAPVKSLLPPGIKQLKKFVPGSGQAVGTMEGVQGQVWVIHSGEKVAYKASSGKPIFTGDLIVTTNNSKLQGVMQDKSVFALTSNAKLKIDKVSYDPVKKERDSFLSLLAGKARFTVSKIRKLRGKYNANYRIKTPSALCGVQGSDFVVSVVPQDQWAASAPASGIFTKFSAFLSPVSTAHATNDDGPVTGLVTFTDTTVIFTPVGGGPPITLRSNSFSWVRRNGNPSQPVRVRKARLNRLKRRIGAPIAKMAMPEYFN